MQEQIQNLTNSANLFTKAIETIKLSKPVYEDGWGAREIISHIIYYHEYYVGVIKAMYEKDKEIPLITESLGKTNPISAKKYSRLSREKLLRKFRHAQSNFMKYINQLKEAKIPYKKGGRIYEAADYVEEIARHIMKHTKDLTRKKRKTSIITPV